MTPRSERGSHAAELAIVMPILLALLSGIFDYGWIMLNRHIAADAADAGARAGAAAGEDDDAVALAEAAASARWATLRLPAEPEIEARETAERIEVELRLPDVRPVQLIPGPPGLVVVRSRSLEASP
ncbi:MAG: TadE/TadG family type IV pilus assembly protein [Myxococcota bacterium]